MSTGIITFTITPGELFITVNTNPNICFVSYITIIDYEYDELIEFDYHELLTDYLMNMYVLSHLDMLVRDKFIQIIKDTSCLYDHNLKHQNLDNIKTWFIYDDMNKKHQRLMYMMVNNYCLI